MFTERTARDTLISVPDIMSAAANLTPEQEVSPTILLVEDEVLIRMVLADQLREEGYRVVEASDADEALALLRHDFLYIDVAITDVIMPGSMDGVGLARALRLERPQIKIILMSAHYNSVGGPDYDAFFPKPYDIRAIVREIKSFFA
jgi:CheY-like chemotaxis protein